MSALQGSELRSTGLDEDLVLRAIAQLSVPNIYRVHFRQNVYPRGKFIFNPVVCRLPVAGCHRDLVGKYSLDKARTSVFPWLLLNRWYANHIYAKVLR